MQISQRDINALIWGFAIGKGLLLLFVIWLWHDSGPKYGLYVAPDPVVEAKLRTEMLQINAGITELWKRSDEH